MVNTGDDLEMFSKDEEGFFNYDYETDLIALWSEMEKMVENGKAKTIGVSNFNEKQIERILNVCKIRPANNQVEIHAYFSNKGIVEYCKSKGITICAYAPLGSPKRGFRSKNLNGLENPVIIELSKTYNKSPGHILLRHLLQRGIIVIPKSGNPARIRENFCILDFELQPEDFEKIEKLDKNHRFFDLAIPGIPVKKQHPEYPF